MPYFEVLIAHAGFAIGMFSARPIMRIRGADLMKALFMLAVIFGGQQYIVDTGLSREDCGAIIAAGVESLTMEEGLISIPENASYECTPQAEALPPST